MVTTHVLHTKTEFLGSENRKMISNKKAQEQGYE